MLNYEFTISLGNLIISEFTMHFDVVKSWNTSCGITLRMSNMRAFGLEPTNISVALAHNCTYMC